jgi:nondiscriminating aspartyl-tRNA synthetase
MEAVMVPRVLSVDVPAHVGQRITIAGWLHRRRELKSVTFLVIRDRAGLAQVVLPARTAAPPEETVVLIEGLVLANDQAPGGAELTDAELTQLSGPACPPPFGLYRPRLTATLPTILDHAPTTLRHPLLRAGLEVAAASAAGFRSAMSGLGFTEIFTPKIVESATEGGANVFRLDYFDRPAYLAQSPQFYKQAMVGVFERVFEVGPAFRAEPHDTARHLAEYTSLDAEMGFIADHFDVMPFCRDAVAGMVGMVRERADIPIRALGATLPEVPAEIPHVHFADAMALISAATGEDLTAEDDLAPGHERWLCEWAAREHGSDLLFVTGYPLTAKPFYTHPDPERPRYSYGFDLLFRGTEIVTGGQRLHRYEDYVAALAARGLDPAPFEGYLQVFRHGMPPHGGFAIGLERWTALLTGAANVRQVTLFPRDLHRLSP